jgi:adhesin HecA-like repeat protein
MMQVIMRNGRINIDGKDFVGSNVMIRNGKVTVDGVVQDGELVGDVNVTVHGDVERLENASGKVVANSAGSIHTQSGDVECGDVTGSIQTMSGDVDCGTIGGSVSTMSGDVKHR